MSRFLPTYRPPNRLQAAVTGGKCECCLPSYLPTFLGDGGLGGGGIPVTVRTIPWDPRIVCTLQGWPWSWQRVLSDKFVSK